MVGVDFTVFNRGRHNLQVGVEYAPALPAIRYMTSGSRSAINCSDGFGRGVRDESWSRLQPGRRQLRTREL
jgi:hypothetical protein